MLEAVVGVALRAILASVVLGGVLAALVLLATRYLALTAATRHALWTTALIATAVMPLAGVAVSFARATVAPTPAVTVAASSGTTSSAAMPPQDASSHAKDRANGLTASSAAHRAAATSGTGRDRTAGSSSTAGTASAAPSLADRLNLGHWTLPRLSRAIALGVVGIWAIGALIGLIGLAASIVRVRGLKRRSSPLDGPLADELPWLTEIGPGREIYLRLSFETETPVAIGFRRPVILIPTELATADGLAAIEQLILHEHAHLRRYDDWTNLVQRAIERIFWFNPIVWLVGRRIALEREIASDDAVVEKTGEAHAYATSLWRLAREMRMPEHAVVAPGALLTRKQITVRIEQLLDKKRARLHRSPSAALGVALASLAAVAFVATSAPAVELPAVADAPSSPAATAWHREAASARGNSVTRRTPDAKNGTLALTAAGMSPAKHASAPQSGGAARTATVAFEREPLRVPRSASAQQQQQSATTFTVRGPSPLKLTFGNGGKAQGSARNTAHARASTNAQELGERAQTLAVSPPAPVPAVPVVPPVPNAAPVPSLSIRLKSLHNLTPEQIAKLQAAAERAGARASHVTDAADFGPQVAKSMQEALATLPREIAQESSSTRQSRMDGVKLSRELVASCVACSFRNADLRGIDLHGLKINADDFSGADFRGANLSGAQLIGVSLAHANLSNADLRNAELNGVELRDANLDGALLDGIKLVGVSIRQTSLRGTMLRSAIASCLGCDFGKMDLRGQDLHGLVLNGVSFADADLRNANLSGAQLVGVSLSRANLGKTDLRNAQLNGTELRDANLDGALLDGIKLIGVSVKKTSLRGTSLRSVIANCTGCDFGRMDLHGQDLHGIVLSGANLSHADLHDANLSGAHFSGVDLSYANLAGADLTNAKLEGCNLTGIELRGARTAGMTMHGSTLDG
jgi:uncharacterized protein YjbI with pentapeptide repeats/beta-lactamase regulating signal transducer with metallopeptidase domain